jgi:hypothetical protein
MHSPAIGEMAKITIPNKSEYCCRNQYSLHQASFTGERHAWPGYDRIPILIDLLKSEMFDWVLWLGCDCLITNLSIKLEDLVDNDYGMVIATDATQVQMDSFLVQPWNGGLDILRRIWESRDGQFGPWYEQSNLESKMNSERFKKTVKVVPQKIINSMRYELYPDLYEQFPRMKSATDCNGNDGQWSRGDFVFHIPGRDTETKVLLLKEMSASIIR